MNTEVTSYYPGNSPIQMEPPTRQHKDEIEAEEVEFDYSGFQVVRREFFAHLQEPSIVFNQGKVGVNTACVRKLPETDYIQILVNRDQKKLVVRPCEESDIHSFPWSTTKNGKKQPRQVTGKLFFMKICSLMNWNPDFRYKIMGKLIRSQDQYLFVFDLTATEMYKRTPPAEGEKPKASRTPVFPLEWKDKFGVPYEDRHKVLQINMFDGFAVYAIGEKPDNGEKPPALPEHTDPQQPYSPEGGNNP